MLCTNPDLVPEAAGGPCAGHHDWHVHARVEAQRRFDQARHRAWLRRVWAALTGHQTSLRQLSEAAGFRWLHTRQIDGTCSVPLRQIVGSDGRSQDFDREFAPLSDHLRERWVTIASLWVEGYPLPPVDLLQIGASYYVLDGHHRISVARTFGEQTIDARVSVYLVAENADAASSSADPLCVSGRA